MKSILVSFVLLLLSFSSLSQEEALHQKINQDMYGNFSKAYETLNYNLFASIHSAKMIRISGGNGGEIKNVKKYLEGYKKRWNDPSRKPVPIDFRLFERVTSDSLVSDRGIYRVTYKNNKGETKHSYGQFHVLLRLENEYWRILIDYDSDENKTVDQIRYEAAYALSDYKKYWKHKN